MTAGPVSWSSFVDSWVQLENARRDLLRTRPADSTESSNKELGLAVVHNSIVGLQRVETELALVREENKALCLLPYESPLGTLLTSSHRKLLDLVEKREELLPYAAIRRCSEKLAGCWSPREMAEEMRGIPPILFLLKSSPMPDLLKKFQTVSGTMSRSPEGIKEFLRTEGEMEGGTFRAMAQIFHPERYSPGRDRWEGETRRDTIYEVTVLQRKGALPSDPAVVFLTFHNPDPHAPSLDQTRYARVSQASSLFIVPDRSRIESLTGSVPVEGTREEDVPNKESGVLRLKPLLPELEKQSEVALHVLDGARWQLGSNRLSGDEPCPVPPQAAAVLVDYISTRVLRYAPPILPDIPTLPDLPNRSPLANPEVWKGAVKGALAGALILGVPVGAVLAGVSLYAPSFLSLQTALIAPLLSAAGLGALGGGYLNHRFVKDMHNEFLPAVERPAPQQSSNGLVPGAGCAGGGDLADLAEEIATPVKALVNN